jgi:hypothetical protein
MASRTSSSVELCRFIDLPQFSDRRGNLSFIEAGSLLPFEFKRFYFLYDVPFGGERAGHAHRNLQQVFFAFSGCYQLHLDDGRQKRTVLINQPNKPFYVCPGIWRVVDSFTSGAVCAVLASELYSEADYIRNYADFVDYINGGATKSQVE